MPDNLECAGHPEVVLIIGELEQVWFGLCRNEELERSHQQILGASTDEFLQFFIEANDHC